MTYLKVLIYSFSRGESNYSSYSYSYSEKLRQKAQFLAMKSR